jgi:hypothetical protein
VKTLQTILASTALVVGLGLAPALLPSPAFAVDNMSSTDAPDLTSVRAKIKAQNYAAALTELRDLAEDVQRPMSTICSASPCARPAISKRR